MITIHLNGEERTFQETLTLQDLLTITPISLQAIAVAINSEVVPRSQFEKVRLRNQDQVEIIHAVGGG